MGKVREGDLQSAVRRRRQRASRHRPTDRRAKQLGGPWPADAGAEQPDAQRDQGWLRRVRPRRAGTSRTGRTTGRRTTASRSVRRASPSPASQSPRTRTTRATRISGSGAYATTSRTSYAARGRHDVRLGGEFLHRHQIQANCRQCSGDIDATAVHCPGRRDCCRRSSRIRSTSTRGTWRRISPLVTNYSIGVGDFNVTGTSKKFGGLGAGRLAGYVEPDAERRACGTTSSIGRVCQRRRACLPFQEAGRPNDTDKLPATRRLCLPDQRQDRHPWRLSGLYYGDAIGADQSFATGNPQIVVIAFTNDGRAELRGESHERAAAAELRTGAGGALFWKSRGVQRLERHGLRWNGAVLDARPRVRRSTSRPPAEDVPDVGRRAAPDRQRIRGDGGLRLQQGLRTKRTSSTTST